MMEDDQDDFWENPLSHLSMGETPEPTSKVPRSILCNRSQGVSGRVIIPEYLDSSTNTAVDDVFEDEPCVATAFYDPLAVPYQSTQGGAFDVDLARVEENITRE